MQPFLSRIMSGRLHATAWTAFTAVLALMLAPLSFVFGMHCVSGALVGLATLRQGMREGLLVLAGAAVLAGLAVGWVMRSPMPVAVLVGGLWVPAWLMAGGLRATSAPGWVLAGAAGVLAGLVLCFRLAVGDPGQWWMSTWRAQLSPSSGTPSTLAGADAGAPAAAPDSLAPEVARVLDAWAPVTTGVFASGFLLLLALTLFLSRWGHAVLDNPGGFGKEFRALAVPRSVSVVTLGLGAVAVLGSGGVRDAGTELVMVLLVLHAVHGAAVVHAVVARLKASRGWLVLLYVGLFVVPLSSLVAMMLAMVGISDGWMGYRQRVDARRR